MELEGTGSFWHPKGHSSQLAFFSGSFHFSFPRSSTSQLLHPTAFFLGSLVASPSLGTSQFLHQSSLAPRGLEVLFFFGLALSIASWCGAAGEWPSQTVAKGKTRKAKRELRAVAGLARCLSCYSPLFLWCILRTAVRKL